MTVRVWSFFEPVTGVLHQQRFKGMESDLAANTPAGYQPIEGAFDPRCQVVDTNTLEVKASRPPAPDDTPEVTWAWSDSSARYVPTFTVLGMRAQLIDLIKARIVGLEGGADRVLRQLVAGIPGHPAAERMAAIDASIEPWRLLMEQAQQAESFAALETIQAALDAG